jgi:APA family basic amino acid/polyamine antiporter
MNDSQSAERTIGLASAVFILVGYTIGASIFILPGQLAAEAGPGAFVSYLIAGAIAAIAGVIGAAIGSAIPVSGSLNVASSQVLAPVVGFMGVWATLVAVAVAISLVSYGLADYLAYFVPGIDRFSVAVVAALGFGLLNLTTIQMAVRLQVAMTVAFLVILFGFGVGGVVHADPALLTPLMPNGFGPVLAAAVPAFFSYAGMTVITEIGGEIKRPGRTVPLALLISFVIVALCYSLVAFAVPALLPWQSLAGVDAPVASAARVFLPAWTGGAIAIGAIFAAATSINAMLLIHSRDVLAMARARAFPAVLGRRNARAVPVGAVALVTGLGVLGTLLGATIREYAVLAVISVMLLQVFSGLVVLRLPRALPEESKRSEFRLGRVGRALFGGLTIASSIVFMVLGVIDSPRHGIAYLVVLALGIAYYYYRRAALARQGHDLDRTLRSGLSAER